MGNLKDELERVEAMDQNRAWSNTRTTKIQEATREFIADIVKEHAKKSDKEIMRLVKLELPRACDTLIKECIKMRKE